LQKTWAEIVKAVARANNSTGAYLSQASPLSLQKNKLLLSFGAEYAMFMDNILKKSLARKLVEEQITAHFGRALKLEGTLTPAQEADPPVQEAEQVSLF
jgi:hypothetical protein